MKSLVPVSHCGGNLSLPKLKEIFEAKTTERVIKIYSADYLLSKKKKSLLHLQQNIYFQKDDRKQFNTAVSL